MAFEAYLNIYNRGESADALSVEKELRRIAPDKETLATDPASLRAADGIWKPATSTCLPTHGTCGRPTWRGSSCWRHDSALKAQLAGP